MSVHMASFVADKPLATLTVACLDESGSVPMPSLTLSLDTLSLPSGSTSMTIEGAVLDGVLSVEECSALVAAAEASDGFGWWDASGDSSDERRAIRNADTLEFSDDAFCAALWKRLAPLMPTRVAVEEGQERYEPELAGEWVATGLNPHLLINRYGSGGHFAPHADGSTVVDFNNRSLYTVLLYLNECHEGGATQLLDGSAGESTYEVDAVSGARVSRPTSVVHAVRPEPGRGLYYWHQVLHAGETVGKGCVKYCLRTDVMFTRTPPECTEPHDQQAFELVREAGRLEGEGKAMEALKCYMRASKLSPGIAKVYGLGGANR